MEETTTLFGVIGTGTISSAVVVGCLTPCDGGKTFDCKFVVSERSAAKSEALRRRFPDAVTVEADNQKIVDACKYVIVSVLPKQGRYSTRSTLLEIQLGKVANYDIYLCKMLLILPFSSLNKRAKALQTCVKRKGHD